MPVGIADVEHAADIGMRDGAADPQLAREPLVPHGILGELGAQDLQRDQHARLAVERAQHAPAAAGADHRLDLEAATQHVTALELRRRREHDVGSPGARDAGNRRVRVVPEHRADPLL